MSQIEAHSDKIASLQGSVNSLSSPSNLELSATTNTSGYKVAQSRISHQSNSSSSIPGSDKVTSSKPSGPSDGSDTAQGGAPKSPKMSETALATVPKPKGVLGYIISRYTWYIERLQQSLANEMPRTFKMFRIFSVGLKSFIKDFTGYVRVLVVLSFPSQRLEGLTLRDLELYHYMPWDMVKVFPVLLISAIPLGQNVALPLGYLFPRQLLCRHFWDLQQTHDFSMRFLRNRVYNARSVFRSLQAPLESIEPLPARVRAQSAWHKIGSGVHPSLEEVLALRPLFAGPPFSLQTIRRYHVNVLVRLHGISALLGGRRALREHGRWLLCHDRALTASGDETQQQQPALHTNNNTGNNRYQVNLDANRTLTVDGSQYSAMDRTQGSFADNPTIHTDGTVPTLMSDSLLSADDATLLATLVSLHVTTLKTSLLLRGISPIGLDSSGMAELLLRWLTVSRHLTNHDYSLLLHLPVLLFYNHPTNLALIARQSLF